MPTAEQTTAAASSEPKSAAARRAAGIPADKGQSDTAGTGVAELGLDTPDLAGGIDEPSGEVGEPALMDDPQPAVTHVGPRDVHSGNITPEELEFVRQLRTSRGAEIRAKLAAAPVGLGTDSDPFTLHHLRGCPDPGRTEMYDTERPDGRAVTVHRCVQCGVQNNIDH